MDNQNNQANLTVQFSNLPLAVYREIAAHLCQVEEVETKGGGTDPRTTSTQLKG